MGKKYNLFILFLSALLIVQSCSKNGNIDTENSKISIYGREYNLGLSILWETNPSISYNSIPYLYKHDYINASGEQESYEISGFECGDKKTVYGDFLLSFYETSFSFIDAINEINGKGAVICFHLLSDNKDKLVEGVYKYSKEKEPFTFTAYSSTIYSPSEPLNNIAKIIDGHIVISKIGNDYNATFKCKTKFDGMVEGYFNSPILQSKVEQQKEASYINLKLAGLLDKVVTDHYYDNVFDSTTENIDNVGNAFFSLSQGQLATSLDDIRSNIDISLVWDKHENNVVFESPIRMISYLGHDKQYSYINHTIYTKAPSDFTEDDYNNLNIEDLANFMNSGDRIIYNEDNFKPGYLFFKSGQGLLGAIKVKEFIPRKEEVIDQYASFLPGYYITKHLGNPYLVVDIRSLGIFPNPEIR